MCLDIGLNMNMYEVNVNNVTLIAHAMSWSQNDDMNPVSEQ